MTNKEKPKQYIQGWVEFYRLKFLVTPDVLIPRPETELLVDEVFDFISARRRLANGDPLSVLDIGTGAGPIAVSIAKNAPDIKVIATDISQKALQVAEKNAKLHHVENQIFFLQGDLLNVIASDSEAILAQKRLPRPFGARNDAELDVIVTNLPYIPSARIPYLDSSVKDFEPHIALDGGEDGFELYRKLFQQIKEKKWNPKLIVGEIDYTQGEIALQEANKYFPEAKAEVKLDLAHKQRILVISGSIR